MGIGETLRWALDKLVMRVARYQAKMACGNLQLCADLDSGIEVATHAVVHRRLEKLRHRKSVKGAGSLNKEEESEILAQGINYLTIDTAGMEEEAAEVLEALFDMKFGGDGEGEGEGEEKGLGLKGHWET